MFSVTPPGRFAAVGRAEGVRGALARFAGSAVFTQGRDCSGESAALIRGLLRVGIPQARALHNLGVY